MREKVIHILEKYTKDGKVPAVTESLFDAGYLDSFGLPDVVSEIEREFSIVIPDSDLSPRKFESIERIQQYIEGRL